MSLGKSATEEDGELIANLFGAIGKIWRADEKYFDAVTGLRYLSFFMINEFCLFVTDWKCLSGFMGPWDEPMHAENA